MIPSGNGSQAAVQRFENELHSRLTSFSRKICVGKIGRWSVICDGAVVADWTLEWRRGMWKSKLSEKVWRIGPYKQENEVKGPELL